MTEEFVNMQHAAALHEGHQYAIHHGHSLTEEVSYGRGFKAGSIWFRNNVWHDPEVEKPKRKPYIHVWYNRTRCCDVILDFDDTNWQPGDLWCYLEDLLPDVPDDLDDVDPKHLVHQHIDEDNKWIMVGNPLHPANPLTGETTIKIIQQR